LKKGRSSAYNTAAYGKARTLRIC